MPKTIIACRSISNFKGEPRPPGDATRKCEVCAEPVSLTERGQENERAGGATIVCNPCALSLAAILKAGGSPMEMRHNPEAVKSLHESAGARRMHDLFEMVFKKPAG